MKPLPLSQRTALAAILADTDVIWSPFRWHSWACAGMAAAIAERRWLYRKSGVSIVVGGGGAERQSGHRDLQALVSRGLIRFSGRGRNRGVVLTQSGDNYARALCPTRRIDEAWWALERVRAVEVEYRGESNAGYMLENDILGFQPNAEINGNADKLTDFEDEVVSLLAAGLLKNSSDTEGRLGYQTTEAGRAALEAGNPGVPEDLPEYNSEFGMRFTDLLIEQLKLRESWRPSTPNQVWIPLSAGLWPRKPEATDD
jgi:hypothetical protein